MKMNYFYHQPDIIELKKLNKLFIKHDNLHQKKLNHYQNYFLIHFQPLDNIFEIIHSDFCKSDGYSIPRSLREIAGWCNAFVLYFKH